MLWFVILSGYFVLAVLLHSMACHFFNFGTIFAKFLVIGSILGCCMLAHTYLYIGFQPELISLGITYGFLCELYIFIFTFISSSISVSILLKVAAGNISLDKLSEIYCGKIMVDNRLRKLCHIGLLIKIDDSVYLSSKGQFLNKLFQKLQLFFRFKVPPNHNAFQVYE